MTETIRAVIVDDEPLGRRRIASLLEKTDDVEVVAQCRNGREAVREVRSQKPDVLFLDIQMPGMDGFDVVDSLGSAEIPVIIFATAYDKYALRAFDVHALDYLLKPFDRERFFESLGRARKVLSDDNELSRLRQRIVDASRDEVALRGLQFQVKDGGSVTIVKARDLDWVEAAGNYAILHEGDRRHFLRQTMNDLEEQLPQNVFLRIHRSTIIRTDRIRNIEPSGGGYRVILEDGTQLKVSRGYRRRIQVYLKQG